MRDLLQELIGKIKRKGLVLGLCANGTITISAQGGRPVSGIYPLMTCTTGGEALKNWTVSFTGNWYGAERTVLTDETGLRLKIRMNRATVVTFR